MFIFNNKIEIIMKIFVGNLAFSTTEDELRELFEEYGAVTSVELVSDRETGRPRGFAFVEMESGSNEAIQALDGNDWKGRNLNINVTRPNRGRGHGFDRHH